MALLLSHRLIQALVLGPWYGLYLNIRVGGLAAYGVSPPHRLILVLVLIGVYSLMGFSLKTL